MTGDVVVDIGKSVDRGCGGSPFLFISMINLRYVVQCILLLLSLAFPIVVVVSRLVFVDGRFLSIVFVL